MSLEGEVDLSLGVGDPSRIVFMERVDADRDGTLCQVCRRPILVRVGSNGNEGMVRLILGLVSIAVDILSGNREMRWRHHVRRHTAD